MTDSVRLKTDRQSADREEAGPEATWQRDDVDVIGSRGLRLTAVHHHGAAAGGGRDGGERPIVVAIHGYPDHQGVWDAVIPHLLPHADVLTYDVRGVGRSHAPASRAGFRLEHLRADLDAVVDAAFASSGEAHLLAHDWGSIQAWQGVTSEGRASRVASFISISGPCLDHVLRWYARSITASGDVGGLEWYRANIAARHDATESAAGPRHTDVPTLVIVPTRDPYVHEAMATCGEPFTARFATRSLKAGHWVVLSHPQQVAAMVLEQMGVSPRR